MNEFLISPIPESTDALLSHAAVRQAVACRVQAKEEQNVVAFVVASSDYLDQTLGRADAERNQTRVWRKTYDLTQFAKTASPAPWAFNTLGWNSSYTRRPLPEDDMREWVETTVDRIRALNPTTVLELGCGTGLLLLRLAGACTKYVGLDFSAAVLNRLREQLAQMPALGDKVEVLERSAEEIEIFPENSFHTVILNSVAQHFPNLSYLNRVLEKSIRLVAPGGSIFVGDQRSLPLLPAFALSVEAAAATPETTATTLRERLEARLQQEQQLVLSPAYFLSLAKEHPKLLSIDIFPRRGVRDNEMTRFRFDAILRVGPRPSSLLHLPFREPPSGGWTLDSLGSRLRDGHPEQIGFSRIRNSRTARDADLLTRLAAADPDEPFSELSKGWDQGESPGIHPETLVELAHREGYQAALGWASCYSDGSYDAVFVRRHAPFRETLPLIKWPQPPPADFVYFANAPGQAQILRKLVELLLSYCRAQLPAPLVPKTVVLVDSLPKGENGAVDCGALFSRSALSLPPI